MGTKVLNGTSLVISYTYLVRTGDLRQTARLIRIESFIESQIVSKELSRNNIGEGGK